MDYPVDHRPASLNRNRLAGVLEAEAASELQTALVPALNNRAQRDAWVAQVEEFEDGLAELSPVPASVHAIRGKPRSIDLVVAADGTHGVVRESLWPDAMSPRSTGITGWAWIVDRDIESGFGPIWGRTTDFGILPLGGGRTYVYGGPATLKPSFATTATGPHRCPR